MGFAQRKSVGEFLSFGGIMSFTITNTVKEMAIKMPGAIKVFEQYGIDYCCGGAHSLNDACKAAQVPLDDVLTCLIELASGSDLHPAHDWQKESLGALVNHLLQTHHVFTRQELMRIAKQLDKVCAVHAQNHPELLRLRDLFNILKSDLIPHMIKEESVLFPYIKAIEAAQAAHRTPPTPFFNTVRNPVRMMMMEHDNAGELLRIIRTMTGNYTPPADACASFRALYEALQALEADLHQHIHLENNILFPRTLEIEKMLQAELQIAG
jgi:regulator of cell morphogenesis and NO signaling